MALKTVFGRGNVPGDAVELTESEAIEYQKRLLRRWPSQSEVLFLKYGHFMAGATSMCTTTLIFDYFRRFFNIKISTTLIPFTPTLFLPALVTYKISERILTNNTLLMKLNCPVCKQLKCSICQVTLGVFIPSIFSFSIAFTINYYKNFKPYPTLGKDAVAFWKETFQLFKRGTKTFQVMGLVHIVAAVFLPYMQNKEFFHVSNALNNDDELIYKLKLYL